jgi:hypothetical protein
VSPLAQRPLAFVVGCLDVVADRAAQDEDTTVKFAEFIPQGRRKERARTQDEKPIQKRKFGLYFEKLIIVFILDKSAAIIFHACI